MQRPHRFRQKPVVSSSSVADKERYLREATAFAAAVAEEFNDPDAEKLYCNVYKIKPCGCIQRFITGGDGEFPSEGALRRATDLLTLHREAKELKSKISTTSHDKGDKRMLRMLRAEGFEQFVMAKRALVRQEMGICERACQRLLFYSNNFLHKDLKTGPSKGPRIKRIQGKSSLSHHALLPLVKVGEEACCARRCAQLAHTHTKQVETWRRAAQGGAQGLRKVVADMLAPRKGLQPACSDFVMAITGCSFSLISKVKESLRRNRRASAPSIEQNWREETAESISEQGYEEPPQYVAMDTMLSTEEDAHREMDLLHDSLHGSLNSSRDTTLHLPELQFQLDHSHFSQFIQVQPSEGGVISAVSPNTAVACVADHGESPPQSQTLTVLAPAAPFQQHLTLVEQPMIISVQESPTISMLSESPFLILPDNAIFLPTMTADGHGTTMQT